MDTAGIANQGEPLLVAEKVRKVYRTGDIEVEALAGLDLSIERGELVAVMGPLGLGQDHAAELPVWA
jgi:putative ABC transport system ATP-binding protein